MPFTFSHPAAILPLIDRRREGGWNEALVMGALIPDLLRPVFALNREITHSLAGCILLDVPAAMALAWLVHRFLTPRLHRLPGLDSVTPGPSAFSVPWVMLAAAIGALSHLAWDQFTHDRSFFTRGGILDRPLFETPAGPFLLGQTSWFIHSALGLGLLGYWFLRRVGRSSGGIRSLLSWRWARLLLVPALPFVALFRGFHPTGDNFLRELFIHLAYMTGNTAQYVLAPSAGIALAMFLLETSPRPTLKT